MPTKTKARAKKFEALTKKAISRLEADAEEIALEEYLAGLSKYSGMTFGKFIEQLEKDGSNEAVMGVKMGTLAKAFERSAPPRRGRKAEQAVSAAGRLSKKDMEKLQGDILGYIKANPDCRKKDIAASLGLPTKKLFSPMKALVAGKKVTTKGKRAGMTYSVKRGRK